MCARDVEMSEFVSALVTAKAEVADVEGRRDLAIHAAARRGHTAIIKVLLINGANVDAQNHMHQTPLHLAFRFGQRGTCRGGDVGRDRYWWWPHRYMGDVVPQPRRGCCWSTAQARKTRTSTVRWWWWCVRPLVLQQHGLTRHTCMRCRSHAIALRVQPTRGHQRVRELDGGAGGGACGLHRACGVR